MSGIAIGPRIASRSVTVTAPGRKIIGRARERASTVDSSPTSQGPPSRMSNSSASENSSATCSAVVGETRPLRLALGAEIGPPNASMRARATGCAGERTATLLRPPTLAAHTCARRGRMSANGPGQNASANFCARTSQPITVAFAIAASSTCAMSGLFAGRCLRRNTSHTAGSLVESHASPYTVSVGNAMGIPRFNCATHCAIVSALGCRISGMRSIYPPSGMSDMSAARSDPSATTTCPACCEKPMPTPPP